MTDLSPAAQAVLTAATQRLYCLDPEDVPTSASEHGCAIAAALRAAADQVVPYEATAPWDELKCDYDGDHWEMRQWVRDKFLAIAAELEQSN